MRLRRDLLKREKGRGMTAEESVMVTVEDGEESVVEDVRMMVLGLVVVLEHGDQVVEHGEKRSSVNKRNGVDSVEVDVIVTETCHLEEVLHQEMIGEEETLDHGDDLDQVLIGHHLAVMEEDHAMVVVVAETLVTVIEDMMMVAEVLLDVSLQIEVAGDVMDLEMVIVIEVLVEIGTETEDLEVIEIEDLEEIGIEELEEIETGVLEVTGTEDLLQDVVVLQQEMMDHLTGVVDLEMMIDRVEDVMMIVVQ